jgi:hypothetical protein
VRWVADHTSDPDPLNGHLDGHLRVTVHTQHHANPSAADDDGAEDPAPGLADDTHDTHDIGRHAGLLRR